jgi:hypothetical protein
MTDMGDWQDLVHCARVRSRNIFTGKPQEWEGKPCFSEYVMVPLNEYQMGNLVDALSQVKDTGDWWGELLNIIWTAMDKAAIKELKSNSGRTFTLDQVYHRKIRAVERP